MADVLGGIFDWNVRNVYHILHHELTPHGQREALKLVTFQFMVLGGCWHIMLVTQMLMI